jgi:hypothetical protein
MLKKVLWMKTAILRGNVHQDAPMARPRPDAPLRGLHEVRQLAQQHRSGRPNHESDEHQCDATAQQAAAGSLSD